MPGDQEPPKRLRGKVSDAYPIYEPVATTQEAEARGIEPPPKRRKVANPPIERVSIRDMAARDAAVNDPAVPADQVRGKSNAKSLMQPQGLARSVLPAHLYERLEQYALAGAPADCGPEWSAEVIHQAMEAGPHTSALTPSGVELLWENIRYQEQAGFVRILTEEELFRGGTPPNLKIS
jgi:hypothetical protein